MLPNNSFALVIIPSPSRSSANHPFVEPDSVQAIWHRFTVAGEVESNSFGRRSKVEPSAIGVDNDRGGVDVARAVLGIPGSGAEADRRNAVGTIVSRAIRYLSRTIPTLPERGALALTVDADISAFTLIGVAVTRARFAMARQSVTGTTLAVVVGSAEVSVDVLLSAGLSATSRIGRRGQAHRCRSRSVVVVTTVGVRCAALIARPALSAGCGVGAWWLVYREATIALRVDFRTKANTKDEDQYFPIHCSLRFAADRQSWPVPPGPGGGVRRRDESLLPLLQVLKEKASALN
jgi:hypothetical protein